MATGLVVHDGGDGSRQSGLGDTAVRLKHRILDEGEGAPALMAAVVARFPTGDSRRGLGAPGVDVQVLAVVSKTLGDVALTGNVGYVFVGRDRALDVVTASASVEAPLTPRWSAVGEVASDVLPRQPGDPVVVVRAGFVHALAERVRLDVAAGAGVTRASPTLLLTIGMTVLLNRPAATR